MVESVFWTVAAESVIVPMPMKAQLSGNDPNVWTKNHLEVSMGGYQVGLLQLLQVQ
eukprot:CAMPEP_0116009218 /NCGR_PEP_ID=MMETSP0321-20121206/3306_1 /TAXON_ID=163516 /ORGANISM="Leptocylindrus danicus var. danicus, Strain B650" /LENGTH=55 /DNA_ID=CAMNT_0003478147 /DNA_START=246 /DNA_END=413 /DNA_ORIENTATION=-